MKLFNNITNYFKLWLTNRELKHFALDIIENKFVTEQEKQTIGSIIFKFYQARKYSMPNMLQLENKMLLLKHTNFSELRYFLIELQNGTDRASVEFWELIINYNVYKIFLMKQMINSCLFIVPGLYYFLTSTHESNLGILNFELLSYGITLYAILYIFIWLILILPFVDQFKCINIWTQAKSNFQEYFLIFILSYLCPVALTLNFGQYGIWILIYSTYLLLYILIHLPKSFILHFDYETYYIAKLLYISSFLTFLTLLFINTKIQPTELELASVGLYVFIIYIFIMLITNLLYANHGLYVSLIFFVMIMCLHINVFIKSRIDAYAFAGMGKKGNDAIVLTVDKDTDLSEIYDDFVGHGYIVITCIDNNEFPLNLRSSLYQCLKGSIININGFRQYAYKPIFNIMNKKINKDTLLKSKYSELFFRLEKHNIPLDNVDIESMVTLYQKVVFEPNKDIRDNVGQNIYDKIILDIKLKSGSHHLIIMNPIEPILYNGYLEFGLHNDGSKNRVSIDLDDKVKAKFLNRSTDKLELNDLYACSVINGCW